MRDPQWFPVFLNVTGARALVVGGGRVALRKCRDLRAAGANVRVVAPQVLKAIERLRGVEVARRAFRATDLRGVAIAIAATDDEAVNRRVAEAARKRGVLVNVVDAPALCSFIVPALLRRGRVTVAVGTGGAAPALAKHLRDRIGRTLGPEVAQHAALLARARAMLRRKVPDPARRMALLKRWAGEEIEIMVAGGRIKEAWAMMRSEIETQ